MKEKLEAENIDDVFLKVLRRNSEMWKTALLAKRARSKAKYPLKTYEDLVCLADDGKESCEIDGEEITLEKAKKYLPKQFFPIENEDEFISKILIAFLWGRKCHDLEAEINFGEWGVKEWQANKTLNF